MDREQLETDPLTAPLGGRNEDEDIPVEGTDKEGDNDCGPAFFEEEEECAQLLARVHEAWRNESKLEAPPHADEGGKTWNKTLPTAAEDPQGVAVALERFERIISVYQESPHLLHSYLEELLGPLMVLLQDLLTGAATIWRAEHRTEVCTGPQAVGGEVVSHGLGRNYDEYDADAPKSFIHHVCRAIYVVVKTAGEKCCTSYFSNDVRLYEDVFYALRWWQESGEAQREWEVRYCLLLWLSNLVLVPFSLTIIDSSTSGSGSLSDTVLQTAVAFLRDTSKCREGAALLVARLLTRPDSEDHRVYFFAYAQKVVADPASTNLLLHGVLLALAKTMKLGQRGELAPHAPQLIPSVTAVFSRSGSDTLLCKAAVKVVQRLALSLLRSRSAPWKYYRHVASLYQNLSGSDGHEATGSNKNDEVNNNNMIHSNEEEGEEGCEEDDYLPEDCGLEEAIGLLLDAVAHKDTVVRWSAAKGIARVCGRLPRAMAGDVVDALLDVFSNENSDSGWHGGLLALAELCRRSLLPVQRLAMVVQFATRGLAFDLSKGTYSVGSHVRDAACYVCWSIARAYNAVDIEEHVHKLSTCLVVTSLFDREVHVRRAAAAAFQESVGRLGNFPDGIRLVTTMDFFSLASLQNAYLHVAPIVAENASYRGRMLEELVAVKLLHWDRRVRCFASQALGQIGVLESRTTLDEITLQLLGRVTNDTVAIRHGAILGIAELVNHLDVHSWSKELICQIAGIIPRLDAARLFRSRGGEYVRQACCHLLAAASRRHMPLPETVEVQKMGGMVGRANTLAKMQEFFEDTWKQILEWLQFDAVNAYEEFAAAYYTVFANPFHHQVLHKMLSGCEEGRNPMERRGNILATGALPWSVISKHSNQPKGDDDGVDESEKAYFMMILKTAMGATKLEKCKEMQDAESRRNAVRSLRTTLTRIPEGTPQMTVGLYESVVQHIVATLDDYAADRRGDVGSFVRQEAIGSLPAVVEYGLKVKCCSSALVVRVIQALLKQAMEKLDRLRGRAVEALQQIVFLPGALPSEGGNNTGLTHMDKQGTFISEEANGAMRNSEMILAEEGGNLLNDTSVLAKVVTMDPAADKCSPQNVFTAVGRPLLLTRLFASCVVEGLVVSAGSLSVHIMQPAVDALLHAFRASTEESVYLSWVLITVAAKHAHNERVVVPLCVTVSRLINACVFDEDRHIDVVEILRSELKFFATNIHALLPLIGVLGDLCRSPVTAARHAAWGLSLVMLASRYPKVRARMGTDMYTSLLVLSAADTTLNLDRAIQQLTATPWDGNDATKVRSARDELYGALGIEKPSKDAATGDAVEHEKKKTARMVASSYLHLVHEAGY